MAEPNKRAKIGKKHVADLPESSVLFDGGPGSVPGFHIRRQSGDVVSFCLLYRNEGHRQRRYTIGKAGAPWTPETAREKARILLGEITKGQDPAAERRASREAATVADLCDAYLEAAEAGTLLTARGKAKKASTLTTDRSRITAHIKPLIGSLKVRAVTTQDCRSFMAGVMQGKAAKRVATGKARGLSNVRGGKGAAARTMGLLGAIFTFAVQQDHRADNPVTGITRPADGVRYRRLSGEEYAAFAVGLKAVATPRSRQDGKQGSSMWPYAVAAARFLALTGWRMGEALALRWGDVDTITRTAWLPDSKTGRSMRPLSRAATDLLRDLGGGSSGALVFPPERGDRLMAGFPKMLERIMKEAKLEGVTAHVLRHSFASVAGDLGMSELTIGSLIGHKGVSVTAKYVHHADAVLLAAADQVADAIMEQMDGLQVSSDAD